jgi:hypothetical protein
MAQFEALATVGDQGIAGVFTDSIELLGRVVARHFAAAFSIGRSLNLSLFYKTNGELSIMPLHREGVGYHEPLS